MSEPGTSRPRFCGQCGHELPPGDPRFCIECGHPLHAAAPTVLERPAGPVTGATVRLGNAPGEQQVLGTTARLVTDAAVPPGMWFAPAPPTAEDTVAVYVPLHAVVGGWSATLADGWVADGQGWAGDGTSRDLVRFRMQRSWFAAPGAAAGLRLNVAIAASSFADEGRTRRGFRYRVGQDPPMEIVDVWWAAPGERDRHDLPTPQVQLMAPPRVRRVSDYAETVATLPADAADRWVRGGATTGLYLMPNPKQQRTPAGRGLILFEASALRRLGALVGMRQPFFRIRLERPLICDPAAWSRTQEQIRTDALALGLDMDSDAMVEWWLERAGHDGVIFDRHILPNGTVGRMIVAFRRSQVVQVES